MRCPLCADETLEPHHRMGIEIDICPHCRGIWLDRGELDRLVAVEAPGANAPARAPMLREADGRPGPDAVVRGDRETQRNDRGNDERPRQGRSDSTSDTPKEKSKRKKKSRSRRLADALEDLFDEIID